MAKQEIQVGLKFKSKHYNGITTVTAIDETKNVLSVRIQRSAEHWHDEDDWNLEHTRWGFENEDYVVENVRPDVNKNNQLENCGSHAD